MAHSTSPQAEWFGDRAFCKELTSCLLASNGSLLFPEGGSATSTRRAQASEHRRCFWTMRPNSGATSETHAKMATTSSPGWQPPT